MTTTVDFTDEDGDGGGIFRIFGFFVVIFSDHKTEVEAQWSDHKRRWKPKPSKPNSCGLDLLWGKKLPPTLGPKYWEPGLLILAGPGTVFCDNTSYVFMFLSTATSNLVATAFARQDKNEVQHQISILLFIGLACGFLMLFFTKFYGARALPAFTGANNPEIIAVANTYVQKQGEYNPIIGFL